MRDAYKKKSGCLNLNKTQLTPRNIRNEMYKFYREHLYPLEAPSFRHTLQWALQTDKYTLNYQFDCGTQLNWCAVEANWRLALDSSSARDVSIVEHAAFASEKRGERPGTWADDKYTGLSFDQVCMQAMDAREERNNEDMQEEIARDEAARQPAGAPALGVVEPDGESPLVALAAELTDYAAGLQLECALPEYAEAAARHEEEHGTTMTDDESDSEEQRKRLARERRRAGIRRYLDDDAEEEGPG